MTTNWHNLWATKQHQNQMYTYYIFICVCILIYVYEKHHYHLTDHVESLNLEFERNWQKLYQTPTY